VEFLEISLGFQELWIRIPNDRAAGQPQCRAECRRKVSFDKLRIASGPMEWPCQVLGDGVALPSRSNVLYWLGNVSSKLGRFAEFGTLEIPIVELQFVGATSNIVKFS
jgi:hypothetical protein